MLLFIDKNNILMLLVNYMKFLEIIDNITVWDDWLLEYKKYVPLFIEQAKRDVNWDKWDSGIFYEFFERSSDQCVTSLKRGYFSNQEKKNIKNKWTELSPLLKQLAIQQDICNYELYSKIDKLIRTCTVNHKRAATYRLIASLQPLLLSTIVDEKSLITLQEYLKNNVDDIEVPSFSNSWFELSHNILKFYQNNKKPGFNNMDIITYPWQTLEFFQRKRVSRICWNEHNWERPSGTEGKSTNPNSYEKKNGYGHEEWLFDKTKLIDGYCYGYLRSIVSYRNKYLEQKIFDLYLYSINENTKVRYWLGKIKKAEIIDRQESIRVFSIYKANGWYDEMIQQLKAVGANVDAFKQAGKDSFAVIKYKPDDLDLLDTPVPFEHTDKAVSSNYYNLLKFVKEPKSVIEYNAGFVFKKGNNNKSTTSKVSIRKQEFEKNLIHNQIQDQIYNILCKEHGKENVGTENQLGTRGQIDIVVKLEKGYVFYEIKTSNNIRECIRDAIGQLLEYAHYDNEENIAELVIITPNKLTDSAKKYLLKLRQKYNIPITYKYFDLKNEKIINCFNKEFV